MTNNTNKGVMIGAVLLALAVGAVGQHFYAQYAAQQEVSDIAGSETGAPSDVSTVVARVNGQPITQGMVERRRVLVTERVGAMFQQLPAEEQSRIVKENLILETLVDQNMKDSDIGSDPTVQEQLREARMQVLRTAYLNKLADSAVSEDSLRTLYTTQLAQMPDVEEIRARHILVKDEAQAKDIIAQIQGGAKFEDLAAQYSEDKGNAAQGGDLGFFARQEMVPEFSRAAFDMKDGELSAAPVKTNFGWHIVEVIERRNRAKPSFEEMKDGLMAAERNRVIQDTIKKWRDSAQIDDLTAPVAQTTDSLETTGGPDMTPAVPAEAEAAPVEAPAEETIAPANDNTAPAAVEGMPAEAETAPAAEEAAPAPEAAMPETTAPVETAPAAPAAQ